MTGVQTVCSSDLEREKVSEKIFEEITVENVPNMGQEILNQVQEAQRVPYSTGEIQGETHRDT